jgi:hypothetical protein
VGVPWVLSSGLDVEGWEATPPSATLGGTTYATDQGGIEISPPASTRKACAAPEGVMEQEAAYLAALPTAAQYRLDGGSLALLSADGTYVASYVRAPGP